MRSGGGIFRFGPFELDSSRRRLMRGSEPVALPDRHISILLLLASNAGQIVSKDALIEAGWNDVAVTDNSIEQAVSGLRKALGNQDDGSSYIETLARRGYRFAARIQRGQPRESDAGLDALLSPYRAFVDGRAALETLDRDAVTSARDAFAQALRTEPDYPPAHIGLANACILAFEATRADAAPDVDALTQAAQHAREGCRLDPASGEAWSTLAFVLNRSGKGREALAAARKAVMIEPDDWRHHLRLAFVSWGEERLRAAHRVLSLCPGLALAYWFAATVFVARQAFEAALEELRPGCASQDAQRGDTGRFKAVGLHLLHGLVIAAQGDVERAMGELTRELEFESNRQLYARECCANTWYAIGALHLRGNRPDEAAAAFQQALNRVADHPLASVGLGVSRPPHVSSDVDVAMVDAAALAVQGRHAEAAQICADALAGAEPGPAGWLIAVDPLLNASGHREVWAQTLALVRNRAA